MFTNQLILLAEKIAAHRGVAESTIGLRFADDGKFIGRLRSGRGLTIGRAIKVTQRFSNHWPTDLPWPADIPRPAPAPDSPAAEALQARQAAAKERPALQLSAKGQIQKPAALCALLDIDLSIYYQATSQYAAGKSRMDQTPRKGSDLSALVAALALVGDCRFDHHKPAAQISMAMPGSALSQRLKPLLVIP